MKNPKTDPNLSVEKDPDDWVSGDDPVTPSQASYLKTLREQAGDHSDVDSGMSKAEASKAIDELRDKLRLERPA